MSHLRVVKDDDDDFCSRLDKIAQDSNKFYDGLDELLRKMNERMDRTEKRMDKLKREALFLEHEFKLRKQLSEE